MALIIAEMGDLTAAGEKATGMLWGIKQVYRQHFSGTLPTSTTAILATGVDKILSAMGYGSLTGGFVIMPTFQDGTNVCDLKVNGSNQLLVEAQGAANGQAYAFTVWYTKT